MPNNANRIVVRNNEVSHTALRHTLTRRDVLRRAALLGVSLPAISGLLVACGGSDEAPPAPGAATTPTPAGNTAPTAAGAATAPPATGQVPIQGPPQPNAKRGGTVIHPIATDAPDLLSSYSVGTENFWVGLKIFEPLLRYLMDGTYEGVLAEKWELSADGTSWTFNLRDGVRWHDGKPFTSADVKFTFEVIAKNQSRTRAIPENLDQIETPNETTAVFKFKQPLGGVLPLLTSDGPIGPRHLLEGQDLATTTYLREGAIGTGPFKLKEWRRGDRMIVERNDDYWDQPLPYIDQIVFPMIPDTQARLLAFEAGELDFIPSYWLPHEAYERLSKLPDAKGNVGGGAPVVHHIPFNLRREIPGNVQVRRACFHALDIEWLIKNVWYGLAERLKSAIPQGLGWAYNPEVDLTKMYPYDPQKAKKMLDDAGYPVKGNGFRFQLEAVYDSSRGGFTPMLEAVRQMFKAVEIDLKLTGLEQQGMTDKLFVKHDYDISYQTYTTANDPTAGVQRAYISDNIGERAFNNVSAYSKPEVDKLFATGANNADQATRQKAFWEVQKILADDIPILPLLDLKSVSVARKTLMGLWHADSEHYDFHHVWWDKP